MKKILIVDDEPYILLAQQFILEENDFEVIQARDAIEAWDKIKQKKPDIAVIDIYMPPSNKDEGITLLEKIKSDPETNNIPVVMLTARGDQEDFNKSKKAGADEIMLKPFNSKLFMNCINRLLSL